MLWSYFVPNMCIHWSKSSQLLLLRRSTIFYEELQVLLLFPAMLTQNQQNNLQRIGFILIYWWVETFHLLRHNLYHVQVWVCFHRFGHSHSPSAGLLSYLVIAIIWVRVLVFKELLVGKDRWLCRLFGLITGRSESVVYFWSLSRCIFCFGWACSCWIPLTLRLILLEQQKLLKLLDRQSKVRKRHLELNLKTIQL